MQLASWHTEMYVKCFSMNGLDSRCPVQLSAEGKVAKQSGNLGLALSHCTVMITFMVPIDFLMALRLVIFTSNR